MKPWKCTFCLLIYSTCNYDKDNSWKLSFHLCMLEYIFIVSTTLEAEIQSVVSIGYGMSFNPLWAYKHAIDKYMVTSDEQRKHISEVLSADPINILQNVQKSVLAARERVDTPIVLEPSLIIVPQSVQKNLTVVNVDEAKSKCSCVSDNVGSMIDKIINDVSSAGKTSIKIQIEITKE